MPIICVSRRFDELGSVANSGQVGRIALNADELSGTAGTTITITLQSYYVLLPPLLPIIVTTITTTSITTTTTTVSITTTKYYYFYIIATVIISHS